MKPYKVDLWDSFERSWTGQGPVFEDLSEAITECNQRQAGLCQSNKDCGEHYGVIDLRIGREVYCAAQRAARPNAGPARAARNPDASEGPAAVS